MTLSRNPSQLANRARTQTSGMLRSPCQIPVMQIWVLAAATTVVLALWHTPLQHWSTAVVVIVGVSFGLDAYRWAVGCIDIMDPVGLVGIQGAISFLLVVPLVVVFDIDLIYLGSPTNWRPWFGELAVLYLLGLVGYKGIVRWSQSRSMRTGPPRAWILSSSRFWAAFWILAGVSALTALLLLARFGGPGGYLDAVEGNGALFAGTGLLLGVAESLPILLVMAFAVRSRQSGVRPTATRIAAVISLALLLQLTMGGFRGSRSNTLIAAIWMLGIIHLWIRPLPRRWLAALAMAGVLFLFVFGFYKTLGTEAFVTLYDTRSVVELEAATGRTSQVLLVEEVSRVPMQAMVLYRQGTTEVGYGFGSSYVHALALVIPSQLRPTIRSKVELGTDVLYGPGRFPAIRSTRAYGITGEGLLNFGAFGAVLSLPLLGLAAAWVRRYLYGLSQGDPRLLILPLLAVAAALLFLWDLGNVVFWIGKNGLMPILLVAVSAKRLPMPTSGH